MIESKESIGVANDVGIFLSFATTPQDGRQIEEVTALDANITTEDPFGCFEIHLRVVHLLLSAV